MANRSPADHGERDSPTRDEVLKRMLKMKPMPHTPKQAKKRDRGKQKPTAKESA